VGATLEQHVRSTYGRVYDRLARLNHRYVFVVGFLRAVGLPENDLQSFLSEPDGWAAYTIAEHDAANFLLETIAAPDIGTFDPVTDARRPRRWPRAATRSRAGRTGVAPTPARASITSGSWRTS
jgi:hypothetical protein